MNRRSLLLSLLAAPAIIRTPGLLMAIRPPEPVVWLYSVAIEELPDGSYRVGPLTPADTIQGGKLWVRTHEPLTNLNEVTVQRSLVADWLPYRGLSS